MYFSHRFLPYNQVQLQPTKSCCYNILNITNFKTLNAALFSYQTILPCSLHSEVWPCVWMGNSSCSKFFHQWDLELWENRDLPIFPTLFPKIVLKLAYFCPFCKVFTLHGSMKNDWKLTVIPTSAFPHNYVQNSCAPKRLPCRLVLFWRTKWVSLNFANKKSSQFIKNVFFCQLIIYYNARHTAAKVDRGENGGQKDFYVKARE